LKAAGRPSLRKEKIVVHDELFARVGVALRRAAKRARKIAAQTNTPIVVFENGKVVKKKVTKNRGGDYDSGLWRRGQTVLPALAALP
jgi:hypothetical protein